MKSYSKFMLAVAVVGLATSFAAAAPPPIRILPTPPSRPIPPVRPVVIVPSTVVISPAPVYFRPVSYAPVIYTPIVPVRTVFSVYYRSAPFTPWVRYNSTTSLLLAETERDSLIFDYGFDAIVR